MVKNNLNKPVNDKAEQLLEEFIAELDTMSSNGVVKHPDMARISDIREHYIGQCPAGMQSRLAEQIDLVLSSKLHYFDRERNLTLSELTESKIIEKIRSIVRSLKDNAPKFIGFALSMRWFNPVHLTRVFLQPAVANSLLTFTVIMNPPGIETLPVKEIPLRQENVHVLQTDEVSAGKLYSDLLNVKPYTEPVVVVSQPEGVKKPTAKKLSANKTSGIEISTTKNNHIVSAIASPAGNLSLAHSDHEVKETTKKQVHSADIRPLSEIQHVFYLNDNRLKSCLQVNSRELNRRNSKVSVKFDITPSGQPKNIQMTDSVLSQKVAERLAIQIYQLRFSRVDKKLGDQSVQHTLFF